MNITPDLYRAQRRRIEHRLKKTRDHIESIRCRILLLLVRGESASGISKIVNCARATVYRTVYRFEEMGEEGLSDRRFHQAPRKITPDFVQRLLFLLEESPRDVGWQRATWTLELLALELEKETGVAISPSHIRNLLLEMNCRRGRPRPALRIPIRGRRKILENIQRLVRRASATEEVFYMDEADVDLNPKIGMAYMKRGHQLLVFTPGQNKKRYLAGALNARTGKLVYATALRKNSGLFLSLLERLVATYRRATKIHLILDNYIIHKSKQTLAWMSRFGIRVALHFLPPYSPESNVIERLWKQMHDQVTRNHRHPTMESLMAAVFEFLDAAQPFPGAKVSTLRLVA